MQLLNIIGSKILTNVKIIIALFFLSISFEGFSQLDKSKEEMKEGNASNNTQNNSSSSSSDNSSYNAMAEIATEAFLYTTYYSFIGDYANENHLHNHLNKYPYRYTLSGNYKSPDSSSTNTVRLDLENKLLISEPNIFGNHLKAKLRPFQFFYFQVDYFQLMEVKENDRGYSNLSLFNVNFCYDRIRFEKFNLGWTLGANYVANDVKKGGFSCGLNAEVFLLKPFSLNSSVKWGLINNVPVNEVEIELKYHKKNYFYCMGFEHLKIATPTYDFVSIGGGIYF